MFNSFASFCKGHCRQFHSYNNYDPKESETLYDVLKVRKSANSKEIRDAFVKLSKKFHPDVNGAASDPAQNEKFSKIAEAYQTLSKPKLRNAYDQKLWEIEQANIMARTRTYHRPWEVHPSYDRNAGPYYGVRGMKRVSNRKVALALLGLGIFGAAFGFASVKHSSAYKGKILDEKNAAAAAIHTALRTEAEKHGNDEQLRRLASRMLNKDRGRKMFEKTDVVKDDKKKEMPQLKSRKLKEKPKVLQAASKKEQKELPSISATSGRK